MVLDDASPQAGSNPANNAPTDTQPRRPPSPNPALAQYLTVKIKPEFVVKPDLFTLYFGFFGTSHWKRCVAEDMPDRVESFWLLANRSPTQEEMDAYTWHSTRNLYHRRVGIPIAAFAGAGLLYRNARRSPLYPHGASPADWWYFMRNYASANKDAFRNVLLAGSVRMMFCLGVGAVFSHAYAAYQHATGMIRDPRLKDFFLDMRKSSSDDIHKRKIQAAAERYRRTQSGQQDITAQIRASLDHENDYGDVEQDQESYGGLSSATDSPQYDTSYDTFQSGQANGVADQQRSNVGVPRVPQTYNDAEQEQPPSQPSSGSDFFYDSSDDDASPTASEYRNKNADGSPAGSAWARIRQQNAPSGSQPMPSRQPPAQWGQSQPYASAESPYDSPSSNQYRYSYDRARDKEQAQAEFDRLMEAERNASTDESPKNKGWGWGS